MWHGARDMMLSYPFRMVGQPRRTVTLHRFSDYPRVEGVAAINLRLTIFFIITLMV